MDGFQCTFESDRITTGGRLFCFSTSNFMNLKADFTANNSEVKTDVYGGNFFVMVEI
jgi:hypothetical protein